MALRAATVDKEVKEGDVRVSGRAVEVQDEEVKRGMGAAFAEDTGFDPNNHGPFHLFRVDVGELSAIRAGGEVLLIDVWRPGAPPRRMRRQPAGPCPRSGGAHREDGGHAVAGTCGAVPGGAGRRRLLLERRVGGGTDQHHHEHLRRRRPHLHDQHDGQHDHHHGRAADDHHDGPAPAPGAATSGRVRALTTPTGVVVPVLGGSAGRWQVQTPCGVRTTIAGGTPVYGATVVVDPGHGGMGNQPAGRLERPGGEGPEPEGGRARRPPTWRRQGATGWCRSRTADLPGDARRAGREVAQGAEAAGVRVHPPQRGPDGPSDQAGYGDYYQTTLAASKRFAGLLDEEVFGRVRRPEGVTGTPTWTPAPSTDWARPGGDYYGILRGTQGVTAALSEGLFLSASGSEAALLARPDVQAAEAEAITRAIRRFMLGNDAGSGFVQPIPRTTPAGPGRWVLRLRRRPWLSQGSP